MIDCARVAGLLDVYVDDETSAETNALILQHAAGCAACAQRLHVLRAERTALRAALAHGRAPAALHDRVRGSLVDAPPSWAATVRNWVVPAAATALVAWIVVPWGPPESQSEMASAVGEHVACALRNLEQPRPSSYYLEGFTAMPLLPAATGEVRVVDAHTCGVQRDYTHVVLEEGGRKASLLITPAGEGAERVWRPERRDAFEVTLVRTTRHRAFFVVDRERSRALRSWQGTAIERVHRFLKQVEGT